MCLAVVLVVQAECTSPVDVQQGRVGLAVVGPLNCIEQCREGTAWQGTRLDAENFARSAADLTGLQHQGMKNTIF